VQGLLRARPREKAAHAHEARPLDERPLLVLAVPSLGAGFLGGWLAHRWPATRPHTSADAGRRLAMALAGIGSRLARRSTAARGGRAMADLERSTVRARSTAVGASATAGAARRLRVLGWFDRYVVDGLMNFTGWAAIEGAHARAGPDRPVRDYVMGGRARRVVLALWGWR
jgi:hypothetical protein